jgi:hypothetical protein
MKSFYEYLAESTKIYQYRVKTVVPVDASVLKRIEKCLSKYDVVKVQKPRKTIVQKAPKDFPNIKEGEVYIIQIETRMPASSYLMQQELCGELNINNEFLVVRGVNEPTELDAVDLEQKLDAKEAGDKDGEALLDQNEYEEANLYPSVEYGDEYNKHLLGYLAKVAAERDGKKLAPKDEAHLFGWLKDQKPSEDFNAGFDTVKPVHRATANKNAKDPSRG